MKPPDVIRREFVQQWVSRAEEDLAAARQLLSSVPVLPRPIGFHAQQATEKYLKAYLVWKQIDFPKTHNIANLLDLLSEADKSLAISLDAASVLTKYAVETRYPGDLPDIPQRDAQLAVTIAEEARERIRAALEHVLLPDVS